MLLLDEMIASPEGNQMSIVSWSRYGDRAGTPDIGVTQLISETLKLITVKVVVIPQHMVMAGSAGTLKE